MHKAKLNIVHLTEGSRWAGIETSLYHLLPSLSRCDGFNVIFTAFHNGQIIRRLREKNVITQVQERKGLIDLNLLIRLVRQFRNFNTDIVHMHGYLSIIYGIPAALLARVPIRVVTLHAKPLPHGHGFQHLKLRIYLQIAHKLIKWSNTQIVAVSEDIANSYMKESKLESDKILVIRNGITIEDIQLHGSHIDNNKSRYTMPIIGIVGRIDQNKGHIYFIKAAQQLVSQGVKARFWIIGDGPLKESLMEYCSTVDMNGHVEFLGFKEDVLKYMAQLSVLIIPSFHEGIPYTMLEAMAISVPVVATAVGGMREVIEDSVNGFLVPVQRPDEIASRVSMILEDAQLRKQITDAALKSLNERFSNVVMTRTLQQAYYNYMSLEQR